MPPPAPPVDALPPQEQQTPSEPQPTTPDKAKVDLVLWGATGFTGRLAAQHLAETVAARGLALTWALAGRNEARLLEVQAAVGKALAGAASTPLPRLFVVDNNDAAAVASVVAEARAILALTGPFLQLGDHLVEACVQHGVDYLDISGETPWARRLMDRHDAAARANGSLVVPMCGFDSIPSDLGVFVVVDEIQKRFGAPTGLVDNYVDFSINLSGGTLATGLVLETMGEEVAQQVAATHLLCEKPPAAEEVRVEERDCTEAALADDVGKWTVPFLMAGINTRVVRRSAEAGQYGPRFAYRERAVARNEKQARRLARPPPTPEQRRAMIADGVLPKPGAGPTAEQRAKAFFNMTFIGQADTAAGDKVALKIEGGDPGYNESARLAVEAALCVVEQRSEMPGARTGGVLTPAMAFGHRLVERLDRNLGLAFKVDDQLTSELKANSAK